jgi:hypothetical protein
MKNNDNDDDNDDDDDVDDDNRIAIEHALSDVILLICDPSQMKVIVVVDHDGQFNLLSLKIGKRIKRII